MDDAGNYCSTPNTPTAKTRISREPSFDGAQNNQEKPTIMTKVHEKAKKWKQILPYIKKHLHGQAHDNEQRQGHEIDNATTSVDLGNGGNTEEHDADYLGAPSNKFYSNNSYPRTCKILVTFCYFKYLVSFLIIACRVIMNSSRKISYIHYQINKASQKIYIG